MDGVIRNIEVPRKPRLQEFDYFSVGLGISFGGNDRGKSIPGFCLTMIILGCYVFLFQFYLLSTLDTTSPKLRFDVITDSSAVNYNSSNSDFNIFFLFSDPTLKVVTTKSSLANLPSNFTYRDESTSINNATSNSTLIPDCGPTGYFYNGVCNYGTGDPYNTTGSYDYSNYSDGSSGSWNDSNSTDNTSGGSRRFLNEEETSYRNLQSGSAKLQDNFLAFDQLKKYFKIEVKYIKSDSTVKNGERVIKKTEFPVNIIPCSKSNWLQSESLSSQLDRNKYARLIIYKSGFCLDFDEKINIYGNWLSTAESYLSIDISLCDAADNDCDPTVWSRYEGNDQFAYLGSFSSTVDNSNKADPFVYDYYFHDQFIMSTQMTNVAKIWYKRLEVKSDMGAIFEEFESKKVGVIDHVTIQNINSMGYDFLQDKVTVDRDHSLGQIEIRGTSKIDQYLRTYEKLFDFIGNLGGAMELVFIVSAILYSSLDNFLTKRKVHEICKQELGLVGIPKGPSTIVKRKKRCCCWTKYQTELDEHVESYVADAADGALAFEQLVKNSVVTQLIQEIVLPPEVLQIAPLLLSLKKAQNAPVEETAKTQKGSKNSVLNISQLKDSSVEIQKEKKLTTQEAINMFMSPQFEQKYPNLVPFKQKFKGLLNPFMGDNIIEKEETKPLVEIKQLHSFPPNFGRTSLKEPKYDGFNVEKINNKEYDRL